MAGCAGVAAREIVCEVGRALEGAVGADAAPGTESALFAVAGGAARPGAAAGLYDVAGAHPPQEPLGHGDLGAGRPALEVDARAGIADSDGVAHRLRAAAGALGPSALGGLVDAEGAPVAPHDDPGRDRSVAGEGRDDVDVLAVAALAVLVCPPGVHGNNIERVFRFGKGTRVHNRYAEA